MFTQRVRFALPWDWTMYRGWYKGVRVFGNAVVPWEFCMAEWNSQFVGDRAFQISDNEKTNLRWEAKQVQGERRQGLESLGLSLHAVVPEAGRDARGLGHVFQRQLPGLPHVGRLGISPAATYNTIWKLKDGVDFSAKAVKVDWENLQRPGFSPDFIGFRKSGIVLL